MFAEVEKPDGSYVNMEIEVPTGECIYCDTCGDCLRCQPHDSESYCSTGGRLVIYLNDKLNPFGERPAPGDGGKR